MERGTEKFLEWEAGFLIWLRVTQDSSSVSIHWAVYLRFVYFFVCKKINLSNDFHGPTQSSLILSLYASLPNTYLYVYYIPDTQASMAFIECSSVIRP